MVLDLEELSEKYAPDLNVPQSQKDWYRNDDGKWYSLVSFYYGPERCTDEFGGFLVTHNSNFVRTDLLEQIGMSMEDLKTKEGFYEALKKVKDENLQYDGMDVIPLTGVYATNMAQQFGAQLEDKEGNLQDIKLQPEYLEALKFYNRLYREGLITTDEFTQDQTQRDQKVASGQVFMAQGWMTVKQPRSALYSSDPNAKMLYCGSITTGDSGNHDYLKSTSYYRNYKWQGPVHMFLSQKPACMEFKELGVRIYGLSYEEREITEPLYEKILPEKRGIASILLAHGGDEKHIPFRKNELLKLGYDYIALGHIHLPAELAKDRMYYAGSLEPTDKNDTGKHGYIKGEIKNGRTRTEFIPFASREYVHMEVEAGREMTGREMKEKISLAIRERGIQNIYKIILRGFRDPDMIYDTDRMDSYGNIVEILDETKPAYDYEKLKKQNAGNLLGWYIESFAEAKDDSVESIALAEGVQAMLEAKGSKL